MRADFVYGRGVTARAETPVLQRVRTVFRFLRGMPAGSTLLFVGMGALIIPPEDCDRALRLGFDTVPEGLAVRRLCKMLGIRSAHERRGAND